MAPLPEQNNGHIPASLQICSTKRVSAQELFPKPPWEAIWASNGNGVATVSQVMDTTKANLYREAPDGTVS